MSIQSGCNDLPEDFYSDSCAIETGGIISVVYLHKTEYPLADFTDSAEWLALINAGTAKVLLDTRGSYPGPDWQVAPGYGETDEKVIGAKHVLTYAHENVGEVQSNVAVNVDFYNKLALSAGQYYACWVDGEHNLRVSTKVVTVKPKDTNPESRDEQQNWQVETLWSDPSIADLYEEAPTILYIA